MVASVGALSVTISAIDRLSGPLAQMNVGAQRLQRNFAGLGSSAGVLARGMASVVPPLGALTAASSVAGLIALTDRWANFAAGLGTSAYRVQTTVSGLHAMQGAARLAGVSAESLTQGLEGLGDALVDAAGGRDTTALQYLNLLKVSFREGALGAKSAAEVLPEVADGIARISDPRLQARVMAALRLPADLLPYLKEGSAGLRRWEADARRFGVVSERGAEAARAFQVAQTRLRMAGEGLVNTIGQRLEPALVPLLERMSAWIADNRELTSQNIGAWVENSIPKLEGMAKTLDGLVSKTVGWNEALTAIGGLWVFRKLFGTAGAIGWAGVELGRLRDALRERAFGAVKERMERDSPADPLGDMVRRIWPGRGPTSSAPAPGRDARDPRGVRNNNPLNLSYVPGQQGLDPAAPSDGRFGRYTSMEAGIAQSVRQMQLHAERRGANTLSKLIQLWAPSSDNNTGAYIRQVERETGLGRDQVLDFQDEATLRKLVAAMARVENGRALDAGVITRGVGQALGRVPTPAAPTAPVGQPAPAGPEAAAPPSQAAPAAAPASPPQKVDVSVRLQGLPAGITATTTTRSADGVRVERSSVGSGP